MTLEELLSTDMPKTWYFYNPAHSWYFFSRNPDQETMKGYGKWLVAPGNPDDIREQYKWAQEIKNPEPYYGVSHE
jgi:hypothetical protein